MEGSARRGAAGWLPPCSTAPGAGPAGTFWKGVAGPASGRGPPLRGNGKKGFFFLRGWKRSLAHASRRAGLPTLGLRPAADSLLSLRRAALRGAGGPEELETAAQPSPARHSDSRAPAFTAGQPGTCLHSGTAGHLPSQRDSRAPAFTVGQLGTCLHTPMARHLPSQRGGRAPAFTRLEHGLGKHQAPCCRRWKHRLGALQRLLRALHGVWCRAVFIH